LTCPRRVLFDTDAFRHARYLDAGHSGTRAKAVRELRKLVFLGLQHCGLTSLSDLAFPNLLTLDISHNGVRVVDVTLLAALPQIRTLVLSGNPIASLFQTHVLEAATRPTLSANGTDSEDTTTPLPT
jgi:hypothetical protein